MVMTIHSMRMETMLMPSSRVLASIKSCPAQTAFRPRISSPASSKITTATLNDACEEALHTQNSTFQTTFGYAWKSHFALRCHTWPFKVPFSTLRFRFELVVFQLSNRNFTEQICGRHSQFFFFQTCSQNLLRTDTPSCFYVAQAELKQHIKVDKKYGAWVFVNITLTEHEQHKKNGQVSMKAFSYWQERFRNLHQSSLSYSPYHVPFIKRLSLLWAHGIALLYFGAHLPRTGAHCSLSGQFQP